MKDYRAFKRYESHEWEQDKEWQGKRLAFIWDVAAYRGDLYTELKLSQEKYDFYDQNDSEVSRIAGEDHYSANFDYYRNRFGNSSTYEMFLEWKCLKNMLLTNFKEFLLKKNCNMYEYLNERYLDGCFYDYLREKW